MQLNEICRSSALSKNVLINETLKRYMQKVANDLQSAKNHKNTVDTFEENSEKLTPVKDIYSKWGSKWLSNDESLNKCLLFTLEVDKMTHILRKTLLVDGSRQENDAEHSWHISLMALIFFDYAIQKVDINHAVKMLIVHDLVEIYAGDTFAYDEQGNKTKAARENAAASKLFSQLPFDSENTIKSLWVEFEKMETADSKYAACMDRLQPFLHNIVTAGHTWVAGNVTRSMVEKRLFVVKEFMPKVYEWAKSNIDEAVKQGYLKDK